MWDAHGVHNVLRDTVAEVPLRSPSSVSASASATAVRRSCPAAKAGRTLDHLGREPPRPVGCTLKHYAGGSSGPPIGLGPSGGIARKTCSYPRDRACASFGQSEVISNSSGPSRVIDYPRRFGVDLGWIHAPFETGPNYIPPTTRPVWIHPVSVTGATTAR